MGLDIRAFRRMAATPMTRRPFGRARKPQRVSYLFGWRLRRGRLQAHTNDYASLASRQCARVACPDPEAEQDPLSLTLPSPESPVLPHGP